MTAVLNVIAATFILVGALLALTAAIGIVRFPDTLSRMHSATKPQVVGLILVLIGAVIRLRGNIDIWMLVLVGLFTILTAPVIAHMVGRVAYREQRGRDGLLAVNEMADDELDNDEDD
ncbi:monovalent cation/H(+) antiporter subunit G [Antrihabitans sp. YC3-6]|uniref:Monovalent cation/H(+) antiporter subunit G n=1 Tax=Antrihabitans stalagmiti TaxID=2799499 RepID=A0A934NQT4_9NOCA|nr:monovalent cation/H(+) antiporter subunit G [Antrihabitans stalagmiti]MBJ8339638.1 monovalent cation/H(+) antiporter subunit G [Antrihabitans stalagmiti]